MLLTDRAQQLQVDEPWTKTSVKEVLKYEKHFQKMYRDVGMAVPKTTETRCRDGSVQGRHVIQRLHN